MTSVLFGSDKRYILFYSSLLSLLGIGHKVVFSINEGFKLVSSSRAQAMFVVLSNNEDVANFKRAIGSLDISKTHVILIVTDAQMARLVDSQETTVVIHSFNLGEFIHILQKAKLYDPGRTGASAQKLQQNSLEFIKEKLRQGNLSLPIKNDVALQILSHLESSKLSMKDFSIMAQMDPTLNAGLLKMANSAYYAGGGSSVDNIDKAFVRLGLNNVKVYLVNFINKALKANKDLVFNKEISQAADESVLTASYCHVLATRGKLKTPSTVFSVGILHLIGMIFLYAVLSDYLSGKDLPPSELADYTKLVRNNHVSAATVLVKRWNFPEVYSQPIGSQDNGRKNMHMEETNILLASKTLCNLHSVEDPKTVVSEDDTARLQAVNMTVDDIAAIKAEATKHNKSLTSIL